MQRSALFTPADQPAAPRRRRATALVGVLAVAATYAGLTVLAPAAHAATITASPSASQNTNAALTVTLSGVSTANTTSPGQDTVTFTNETPKTAGGSTYDSRTGTGTAAGSASGTLTTKLDTRTLDPGSYDITVTNPTSQATGTTDTCTACLTITATAPAPSTFTDTKSGGPNLGPGTSAVPFTLTGANFADSDTVAVYKPGTTTVDTSVVFTVTAVTATQLSGTVTTGGSAAPGQRTLVVTHVNGVTGTATNAVTIDQPLVVSSISPSALAENVTHDIAVTGSGFVSGSTVTFAKGSATTAVTVNKTTYNSPTSLTVNVTTPAASGTTDTNNTTQTLTVTNPNTATATATLTVDSDPTFTTITPAAGAAGTTQSYTVAGTNFVVPSGSNGGTVFTTNDPLVTVTATTVTSTTGATITLKIDPSDTAKSITVTATNPDFGAASHGFTVNNNPTVTGVSPSYIAATETKTITITGTGFTSGTTVSFAKTGVTGTVTAFTATSLTVSVTTSSAAPGNTPPTVKNADGGTGTCANPSCFVVNSFGITKVTPNAAANTGPTQVVITASGLNDMTAGNYTVTFTPTSAGTSSPQQPITATASAVSSSAVTVTADFTGAAPEAYGITITDTSTPGTGRCDSCFTVTGDQPTITTVSPSAVTPNEQATLTLTGTAFAHGFALSSGTASDLTVTGASYVSQTQITATVAVPSGAKVGDSVTLTYTGTDGDTATTTVTVVKAPVLTVAAPTAITAGQQPSGSNASASITNGTSTPSDTAAGADIVNARVDFVLTPPTGEACSDVDLQYQSGSTTYTRIPLTSGSGGTCTGYFGPQGGFEITPNYAATTNLKVSLDTAGTHGTLAVVANLDQVTPAGATTDTLATATKSVTVNTPPTAKVNVPAQIQTGAAPVAFTGTATNYSGTDYNARYDLTLSGISGLKASQVTLQYQNGSAYVTVPLTDQSDGTITGYFGPANGFSFPNGTSNTTNFQVSIAAGAPTGTLTTVTRLDQVSSSNGSVTSTLATDTETTRVYGAPTAPTGVSATTKDTSVTVSFTGSSTSGDSSPVDHYTAVATPAAGGNAVTATGTGSPITITGLTQGATYAITVTATNVDNLTSPASSPAVNIQVGAPGAPTNIAATAGNQQATVSFTAPTSTGDDSTALTYTVTATPSSGTVVRATGTSSPITVTGLMAGTSYTFTVTATNAENVTGPASSPAVAATPYGPPSVPQNVMVTPGNRSLSVSFTAPASTGDGATSVTSYTATAKAPDGTTVSTTGTSSPLVIAGLTAETQYAVTVTATNSSGVTGSPSTAVNATPYGPPGAPTGVTAKAGNQSATVTFTAPTDSGDSSGAGAITSYTVTATPASGTAVTATGKASPITVSGLTAGTQYSFAVTATNNDGVTGPASSPAATATPYTAPSAPQNVSVAAGNQQATVTFSAPASTGDTSASVSGYTVTATPPSGSSQPTVTQTGTASPITVTKLVAGTQYAFTVTATNAEGVTGPASAAVTATPYGPPTAPQNVTVTPGNQSLSVAFSAPTSTGDSGKTVTSYTATATGGGKTFTQTGTSSLLVISGLTAETTYTVSVTATNSSGTTGAAATATGTPYGPPGAPTKVTATAGNRSASVSFTAPTDSGDSSSAGAITSYTVTATPASGTPVTATGTASPITVTGLTAGTQYSFTVTATNNDKLTGPASSPAATATPYGPPTAPTNVAVTPGDTTLSVSFTAPSSSGDGSPVAAYTVTATAPPGSSATTVTATGTSSPVVVTGLTDGVTYAVTVTATNADKVTGPASSPAADGTPVGAPGAPTGVTAKAGYQSITATFTAPANSGDGKAVASYTVTATPASGTAVTATGTTSPITVSGLTAGVSYAVTVTATNAAGKTGPASSAVTVTDVSGPGSFVGVTPTRILDTRHGLGAAQAQVPANGSITVQITGAKDADGTTVLPSSNIAAVVLNLTATNVSTAGYVTAYPSDASARPNVSNLFHYSTTLANDVVVPVSATGKITLFSSSAADLLADVSGYYLGTPGSAPTTSGAFAGVTPARILDTRNGNGAAKGQVPANGSVTLTVDGAGGVPKDGVSAVVLNVTAANPAATGYVTVYPSDQTRPTVSNLFYYGGSTISTLVEVPVSKAGTVTLFTSAGSDLLADVAGYVVGTPGSTPTAGGAFAGVAPNRILDTRKDVGTTAGRLPAHGTVTVQVTGTKGVPTSGVSAVVLTLTAVNPSEAGFLSAYPGSRPNVSNVNYPGGRTVPNLVVVPVSATGTITIYADSATDVLADVTGYVVQ